MSPAGSGALLGREAEVVQAVQVLTGEAGGSVAVVGEAGMGKSALVAEVSARVADAGVAVRATTGATAESDLPFVGLHDLVGADLTAGDLSGGAVELPGPLRAALEVAVLRLRPAGTEPGVDPVALNLAVLRVVEHLSADRRLLLVLDDLPWVDAATRSALAFVLRRVPPHRVSTLLALRPDAPPSDLVAPGAVRRTTLGPLDADTLAAVVEARLEVKLSHRFAGQLHEASGGNPLLALELARSASLDHGAIAELTVPERYRAVLGPRLEALSDDAGRALLAAALLSRPTLEELADVVSVDGLLEAEAAGVVRVEDGRVGFTHPMLAALCRDTASSTERRDMHARLAKTARDPLERARHLGAATLLPDEGVAVLIEQAAEQARGRAAIAAAADLMHLAARATPMADPARRTARACAAALLFAENADGETARAVLRPLLDDLGPGPSRARCLAVLAHVTSEDSEGAAVLFREASRQPGLDADSELELRYEMAGMLGNLGDFEASRAAMADLEADAVATGRDDLARRCRAHLAWIDLTSGTPPARSDAWSRVVEEVDAYEFGYDHPDLMRAWEAMAREDNERSAALIEALMERARAEGNAGLWAMFAQHLGDTELRRGNIAAACRLTNQAYRVIADGRHDESPLYWRAIAVAWQGRLDDARADAEAALAMAERDHNRLFEPPCHHALGFVELSAGNAVAAASHYDAVAAGCAAMGWRHPSLFVWHGNAVEALLAAGRRPDAAALTEDLAAMAADQELATSVALVRRCRGLLCADAGDLDTAAAELDESLRLSEPLDNPLEHARTLLVRGLVHRRRRQKARSRADLGRARATFETCGAAVWAGRAARELERVSPAVGGADLTGSERAVAQLAASGASNREIAAELYVSEKTVEAVLTRVYRKLGVRSRTQLGRHPELVHAGEEQA